MPQPIESAPTNGTPVLTDCGFALCISPSDHWGLEFGRVECDPFGNIYECADSGYWHCNPKMWEPVPQWILP